MAISVGWAGQQGSLLDIAIDPTFLDYAYPDVYKKKKVHGGKLEHYEEDDVFK